MEIETTQNDRQIKGLQFLNNESKLISAQRKQNPASNDRQCLDRIQSRIKRVLATSVTCLVSLK